MLGKFKDAAVNVISKNPHRSDDNKRTMSDKRPTPNRKCSKPEKYVYARPYFLGLDREEVLLSVDFGMRPILSPRKIQDMPIFAGYAEYVHVYCPFMYDSALQVPLYLHIEIFNF